MNSKKFKQIGIEYNSSSQGKLKKDELEYANEIFVTALSEAWDNQPTISSLPFPAYYL